MRKKIHHILDIISIVIGILCILYFLYLSFVYGFFVISFSWIFLLVGSILTAYSAYELYKKQYILHFFPIWIQRCILTLLTFSILFFVSVEGYILYQGQQQDTASQSTAIVLGAQLNGRSISRLLRYRLDAAVEFANINPESYIIVSGGKGAGEEISEASAMRIYLIEHGVAQERILIEDKSTNTLENIQYSARILDQHKELKSNQEITIISNSFHLARAKLIAQRSNVAKKCYTYRAKTDLDLAPVFYVREFFGFCKDFLLL